MLNGRFKARFCKRGRLNALGHVLGKPAGTASTRIDEWNLSKKKPGVTGQKASVEGLQVGEPIFWVVGET